ncbi:MAG TPA: type II toxin-antitoxin system VapC family toxin [Acidimicrobiales bacterium]|nr:type II toxin-antitoxin system VapC family toxin [Acidimicrobiales bacterium]
MNLLLDTHAILWWLGGQQLSREATELIEDGANVAVVSAASVWEVAIKRGLGKLKAPTGFAEAAVRGGFEPLAISHEHAELAGALPPHHRDPFDRMLVAQARVEALTIVSRDAVFERYGVAVIGC